MFDKAKDDFMNLFGKNVIGDDFNIPNVSEQMVRRDNHFHSCWMLLKQEHPELWDDMTKIELIISGYNPDEKEDEPEKDDENDGVTM